MFVFLMTFSPDTGGLEEIQILEHFPAEESVQNHVAWRCGRNEISCVVIQFMANIY